MKGTVIGTVMATAFCGLKGVKMICISPRADENLHSWRSGAGSAAGCYRKGRREARIVRVLVPKTSQLLVATLPKRASALWFLTIAVELRYLNPARSDHGRADGLCVVVELTQRPTRRTKAVGKIVKCWATIWAPAWRLISLCVPINSVHLAAGC